MIPQEGGGQPVYNTIDMATKETILSPRFYTPTTRRWTRSISVRCAASGMR